jgi:hypothetical protein
MAKTYFYQGAEILAPITISSNEPHFDMTTVSLKTQRASQDHQRWELSFNVLSDQDKAAELFLSTIVNFDTSDTMIMPQLVKEANTNTLNNLTLNLAAIATAGSSSVLVNNSSNVTGKLPKGSFIKFSNHSKVYITTSALDFTGSADKTLNIYPNLLSSLAINNTIKTGDDCVISYFKSIDNQMGITYTDGILSNIGTVNLIEAL